MCFILADVWIISKLSFNGSINAYITELIILSLILLVISNNGWNSSHPSNMVEPENCILGSYATMAICQWMHFKCECTCHLLREQTLAPTADRVHFSLSTLVFISDEVVPLPFQNSSLASILSCIYGFAIFNTWFLIAY